MIQIGLDFIRAYSPSEQLIMLYLLLHADENGNVDFCERNISRVTEVSYKTCRTIHQRFKSEGVIKGAPKGAVVGAVGEVVTICDFDSYNVLTKIRAHVDGALKGALKEQEITKEKEEVSPHTPLPTEKENNKEKESEEKPSIEGKKTRNDYPEEYENDFSLYGRKGSKKNGFKRWKELTEDDKAKMRLHIPYYLQSNDRQYLKDFEGYINQRLFESPVYHGSNLLYDPMQSEQPEGYHPLTDNCQIWDDRNQCLRIFNGDIDNLNDGYTDANRPDGATVAWGMYLWKWNKAKKEWIQ